MFNQALSEIQSQGFALLSASPAEFERLCEWLGEVIHRTDVQIRSRQRSFLSSPGGIALHTDHPDARLVAWLCLVQDDQDGATHVRDGRAAALRLSASDQELLRHQAISCPPTTALQSDHLRALLSGKTEAPRVFFAPWRRFQSEVAGYAEAFSRFVELLNGQAGNRIRLRAGDVLVVDNHRMLHGRGAIHPTSRRHLLRRWIA